MDLNHEFTVNQSIDETWKILTDLERIAPCLPGAQLEEVEGDTFRGTVKVKVGPILAKFKGEARFVEQDNVAHKAVLDASGRDTGGKGNAAATITAQLEPVSDTVTTCKVLTDLSITGRIAQFGRSALAEISDKLLAQFATNLNELIEAEGGTVSAEVTVTDSTADASADAAEAPQTASTDEGAGPTAEATVRKINGPAAEPLDGGALVGPMLAKRLLPIVGVLVVVWLLLRRRRR